MMKLSEKQVGEFFHRSYKTVDGLWFVKVEEKYGFEVALDIDEEVWKVMPKIQARFLKKAMKMEKGLEALRGCLELRLRLEGFKFESKKIDNGFEIVVSECPWHTIMIRSGREHLSEKVGGRICSVEYTVWAREFGEGIRFELGQGVCKGEGSCVLRFTT